MQPDLTLQKRKRCMRIYLLLQQIGKLQNGMISCESARTLVGEM